MIVCYTMTNDNERDIAKQFEGQTVKNRCKIKKTLRTYYPI